MTPPAPVHFATKLPPFTLSCGVPLPHHHVHGWAWGPGTNALAPLSVPPATEGTALARDAQALAAIPDVASTPVRLSADVPTVVLVHALTGDAVPGSPDGRGWWGPLIGPGRPLDPTRLRLICFNLLGSCYGTYGPSDHGFPTRADLPPAQQAIPAAWDLPDHLPAPLSAWDQARSIWLALQAIGLDRVAGVIGGSLGGFVALGLAALRPQRCGEVVAMATDTRSTPWTIGFNHLGRQALVNASEDTQGLALARQIAHLTYRANPGLMSRQGTGTLTGHPQDPRQPRRIQTYLQHHGHKLTQRFSSRAYLCMLDAMDHFDLDHPPRHDAIEPWELSGPWGLERLRAQTGPLHLVGLSTDRLFPPDRLRAVAQQLADRPSPVIYHHIDNPHGHDAFLMDWPALHRVLQATSFGATA